MVEACSTFLHINFFVCFEHFFFWQAQLDQNISMLNKDFTVPPNFYLGDSLKTRQYMYVHIIEVHLLKYYYESHIIYK